MKFNKLTQEQKDTIVKFYNDAEFKADAQIELADRFGVTPRTIRKWCNQLGTGLMKQNIVNPSRILVYDIETCRVSAKVWWTGKQYINHHQLREEPRIISISWKWLGEDKIYDTTWDKYQSDKQMMELFLKEYNKADMVIGQNNDRFDNRWVNARAVKHGLKVNTFVRSFDIMKEVKRLLRLPSYSMAYITKFLGVSEKMKHEGMIMWDKIEEGTNEEKAEYLKKMVDYNRQDIISTEDMYLKLRPYMGHKVHFGVLHGEAKWTCPNCGSKNVKVYKTTVTAAGTVQRIMECQIDEVNYKITNRQYMAYLDYIIKNHTHIQ